MHTTNSPLSGKCVKLKDSVIDPVQNQVVSGAEFVVEDWFDRLLGQSWMGSGHNWAAIQYALRLKANNLPIDDEVLYGKIGAFGHAIHVSEIAA